MATITSKPATKATNKAKATATAAPATAHAPAMHAHSQQPARASKAACHASAAAHAASAAAGAPGMATLGTYAPKGGNAAGLRAQLWLAICNALAAGPLPAAQLWAVPFTYATRNGQATNVVGNHKPFILGNGLVSIS